jgi:hypothetical protein
MRFQRLRRDPETPTRRYVFAAAFCVAIFGLAGCDNRTRDDKRWEEIAEVQKTDKNAQPWPDAGSPWSEVEDHAGLAW